MEVSLKQVFIAAVAVFALLLGLAIVWTLDKRAHDAQIVQLQNEVASRDKTVETQKGVYQKLTIQSDDLSKLLDTKDEQLKGLRNQLDKTGAQLLTANTLVFQLKNDLKAKGNTAVVVSPSGPGKAQTFEIKSSADLGPFNVVCDTTGAEPVSSDAKTDVLLSQKRPLRLSVVVAQDKDGTWRTTTTSSESDFQVDIGLASVNPYLLEPKWYEKIGMGIDLGVSTNPGFLAGIGIYYGIGNFEFGPRAWFVFDRGASPFLGAQLLWHPFKR